MIHDLTAGILSPAYQSRKLKNNPMPVMIRRCQRSCIRLFQSIFSSLLSSSFISYWSSIKKKWLKRRSSDKGDGNHMEIKELSLSFIKEKREWMIMPWSYDWCHLLYNHWIWAINPFFFINEKLDGKRKEK